MATFTNFDIPFFADKALQGFVATLVPLNAFSFSATSEPISKGTTALVPLIASLTATTFGGSYAICGGSASVITVTVNRHKHVPVGQNDLTAASSSRAQLSAFAYQQGAGLAVAVLQDIWTLLTTANFARITAVASTALGVAELRAARLALNQNKVPATPRSFVLDNIPYDSLLGTTQFMQAMIAGSAAGLREGSVGQVLGAAVFETNALPGTNSVMGFYAGPSAIAIAMRYLSPGEAGQQYYIDAKPVSDPDTGITMGLRHHYDPNTGTEYVNLEANYGYAAGMTQAARIFSRTD
jgi:hypothetical protein